MTQQVAGSKPVQGATCSCRSDKIYGLVRDGKLRRLTFSADLARFIQLKNPDHEIWILDPVVTGEATSTSLLYGIQSSKGRLLRATISYAEALYLSDDPSRQAVELRLRSASKLL